MIGYRLIVKVVYFEYKSSDSVKETVVIFGAGESGIITKRTFDRDGGRKYRIAAFVDENQEMLQYAIDENTIIFTWEKVKIVFPFSPK